MRPPTDHFAIYEDEARKLGVNLGDYIVMRMALAHGLDVPWYITTEIERSAAKRSASADVLDPGGSVVPLARSA